MFKYLFGEKMSMSSGGNELITCDYPISTLPDFILESEYFKNWSELCPNEHMITLSNKMYLENLEIKTVFLI